VHVARDEVFAGAGLTTEEHLGVAGSHVGRGLHEAAHRLAGPDDRQTRVHADMAYGVDDDVHCTTDDPRLRAFHAILLIGISRLKHGLASRGGGPAERHFGAHQCTPGMTSSNCS
jgi:hypothetical protein